MTGPYDHALPGYDVLVPRHQKQCLSCPGLRICTKKRSLQEILGCGLVGPSHIEHVEEALMLHDASERRSRWWGVALEQIEYNLSQLTERYSVSLGLL